MKPPRIYPDCGANLDPQERCNYQDGDEVSSLQAALEKTSDVLWEQIIAGIRKDARIRELMVELENITQRVGALE
jgi:hypothetical protein